MTPSQAQQLKTAIRKLVLAEVADSWKGAGYPEDILILEEELRAARIRVSVLIQRFTVKESK
jgi:hypothetical protein